MYNERQNIVSKIVRKHHPPAPCTGGVASTTVTSKDATWYIIPGTAVLLGNRGLTPWRTAPFTKTSMLRTTDTLTRPKRPVSYDITPGREYNSKLIFILDYKSTLYFRPPWCRIASSIKIVTTDLLQRPQACRFRIDPCKEHTFG